MRELINVEDDADANEFSGIMSSPGLCNNNSMLDDPMNNFIKNLKSKDNQLTNNNLSNNFTNN